MAELIPVILAKNSADFKKKLATVKSLRPRPKWIQIDVVDGKFAPWKTWTDPKIVNHELGIMNYEVDLMVVNPLKHAKAWIKAGAKRILFHIESSSRGRRPWRSLRLLHPDRSVGARNDVLRVIEYVKSHSAEVGLSLNAATPVSVLYPYLLSARSARLQPRPATLKGRTTFPVDCVLLLGVNPGRSGQPFQSAVLKKIRALRKKFPTLPIEVDGGVSLRNAALILRAGATRLAAASAIHGSKNPQQAYQELLKLTNNSLKKI